MRSETSLAVPLVPSQPTGTKKQAWSGWSEDRGEGGCGGHRACGVESDSRSPTFLAFHLPDPSLGAGVLAPAGSRGTLRMNGGGK